jgi:Uma2 family endonuclease
MSLAKSSDFISEDQYLKGELNSEIRHEYVDGNVYAMAGAGKNHRRLTGNIFSLFHAHLQGNPCEASMGDARVKVASSYFYPDVVIDCDESTQDSDSLYAQQPTIVIEVLSRTTRHLDRGAKLLSYINIPSLQEYVLVEQEFASIDVLRKSDGWVPRNYALGDDIHFESVDLTVSVEAIYQSVVNQDMAEFFAGKG